MYNINYEDEELLPPPAAVPEEELPALKTAFLNLISHIKAK